MSLLEQAPELLEALSGAMVPKFLATRSAAGAPNVVPLVTLAPTGDQPDMLFFGNFLLRKSIRNLGEDARVGVLVITEALAGWALTGDFLEFQRTGPYFERQMASPLLRYNAYTGIRNAGLIRLRTLEGAWRISRLAVAWDFLLAMLKGGRGTQGIQMPLAVRREFARMAAVKVLAWVGDDGYPTVVPALSLQPAGAGALVCRPGARRPPAGAAVAANVLTLAAVSYQAKGRWLGDGTIEVQEVYAGGPPIPGGRVA